MPRGSVPLVSELEARIDEALVIARASEDGVREVGEMALDAARQARRAAEAAERSAEAAAKAARTPQPSEPARPPVEEQAAAPRPPQFDVRLRSFSERADRVSARLQQLCERPGASSVGAARQRGDG